MAIKSRNKVSAEFSMSSLTDIIFLLLIFFMLTSTLVKIQPFELPKADSKTVAPTSIVVSIDKKGKYTLNSKTITQSSLIGAVSSKVKEIGARDATITIVAEVGVPWKKVSQLMTLASQLQTRAIIATEPPE